MENRRTPAIIALGGVILAVVLFLVLKDDTGDQDIERPANAANETTSESQGAQGGQGNSGKPEAPPEPDLPVLEIKNGGPVGGVAEFEFTEGEKIEFEVITDAADELHLHAYDEYIDIEPGKPTTVSVDATIGGVVELESHTTGALLAEISINPS